MHTILWTLLPIGFIYGQNINIIQIFKQDTSPQTCQLNSSYQYILFYNNLTTLNPFRVRTFSSSADSSKPILVVAHQEKDVTAWSLPLIVENTHNSESKTYNTASKTLCHDHLNEIIHPEFDILPLHVSQNIMISLSTASYNSLDITVELEEENIFFVNSSQKYSLSVSPSEPRFVFYKFDGNTSDTVVVEINSQDEVCLTASIQNSRCPVFDMNSNIEYEGVHQTINTKGSITIPKRHYDGGFFIVFVAKPDNYECSEESSILPRLTRVLEYSNNSVTTVTFEVRNGLGNKEYDIAIGVTIAIILVTGFIFIITAIIFHRFGTISKSRSHDFVASDHFSLISSEQITDLLQSEEVTLSMLARNPKEIKKRSYNYLSHTVTIAIFYSIPVVQLVVTYQRIVNRTGDEDMCYYNFLCAHPFLGFSDFNHIISNIGYIFFGIIFICVVVDRHRLIKMKKDAGIPVHYGLFHAMGVALIIEGLLSACYHICPSQANYQFDTSFMYVMAVLCMIKLYQNRHPDVNATAYSTFSILGLAVFMAMVGILNGNLVVTIIFVLSYSSLIIFLSFKIYFFGYVLKGLNTFKETVKNSGFSSEVFCPIRKTRFVILLITNIANFSMLGAGLILRINDITDFGTFLLALLMGNAVVHTIFYSFMKLIHKERICIEAICYGLLAIGAWVWSGLYFLDAATLWTVTPAESRQLNQECLALKFYDKHDMWHLLSAPALYLTFMYLMSLDDDIMDKPQSEIPIF